MRREVLQSQVGGFVSSANSNFAQMGLVLNRMSGYDEIQGLKQTARISQARQAARDAKAAYDKAAAARVASQREVNDLLQRKTSWSEADVSRFTALVRADHQLEQEEARAKDNVVRAEDGVEHALSALTQSILARYHEEQVWSDKIRRLSTYGQLGAMALNVLVFVTAIVWVEPWKRKRLGETFERRVEALEKEHAAQLQENMGAVRAGLEAQAQLLETLKVPDVQAAPTLVAETPEKALDDEQRRRLEALAVSALGGAVGAGLVTLIIQLVSR
ncbi:hypothetical protein AURDEDRAFT_69547 [Auricularia subglabra TFB-10046 SS5]|uniref:Sensitive to high expression protein 9, mitochondrial n=1 Tax=Auricularia subglabra (strain TFB-10046 / SS5) TaxID=717982 RepID=J0WYA7_AURST|nr:hypothetical protein AURDEDRAFT_69547 [Auricularia subglabra TFB-10046 SS5]